MAVGDLEGKIGELSGQLKMLAPILEALGVKVGGIAEKLAAQHENLKQAWHEINALKKKQDTGTKMWWQVGLAFISAVIGAVVTVVVVKLTGTKP